MIALLIFRMPRDCHLSALEPELEIKWKTCDCEIVENVVMDTCTILDYQKCVSCGPAPICDVAEVIDEPVNCPVYSK